MRRAAAVSVFVMGLALACGVKGPPLPPVQEPERRDAGPASAAPSTPAGPASRPRESAPARGEGTRESTPTSPANRDAGTP
jgi:hypothetical protein